MTTNTLTRLLTLSLLLTLTWNFLSAQTPMNMAAKKFTYTYKGMDGTNATAVAWVPDHNIYITAIAGNSEFPLEGFSATGTNVFSTMTGLDIRGLWWNPKKKRLEANAAGDLGWYYIELGASGEPIGDWQMICEGQNQPDFQSAMTLAGKVVVGYMDGYFYHYNAKKGSFKKDYPLNDYDSADWALNLTTVGYTGISQYPLAVLDYSGRNIVFFGLDGSYKGITSLPESAVTSEMFRFSIANKYAWLYDVDTRTWTCFRIFE